MLQATTSQKIKTHILYTITFFFYRKSFRLWGNVEKIMVERRMPQMTVWRKRIAWWITKATNTHSQYVILFCFSTKTTVTWTLLDVTLYVHCLYCYMLYWMVHVVAAGTNDSIKFLHLKSENNCKTKTKLRGFSPRANYTDRAAAAGRRS